MSADLELPAWHAMLRQLVNEKGGEAEVAGLLCKLTRQVSAANFAAARRSLANWTAGSALPQKKNFNNLTEVLGLKQDAGRLELWNALYVKAGKDRQGEPGLKEVPVGAIASRRPLSFRWLASLALALLLAAVGVSSYQVLGLAGDDSRTIGYLPFAELKVGETVLVHAKRGECGKPPPAWHEFEHEIPKLTTGRLVDDGLGTSRSTTCGGVTPGRLVRFVAERPGEEIFTLFERKIKVVVRE